MKTIESNKFFKELSVDQMIACYSAMSEEVEEDIAPELRSGEIEEIDFMHFLSLQNRYYRVLATYRMEGKLIRRDVKHVHEYESEFEMEFYMALYELENRLDPNPVLFN
jgi:hypothetical protein